MPNILTKRSRKTRENLPDEQAKNMKTLTINKPYIYPMQYIVGSGQSVGLQRDHNEDSLFALSSVLSDGKTEEPFGLFIIADGMGGHRNGEVASSVAIRVVARYVIDQLYKILLEPQQNTPALSIQEILTGAVAEAQKAVTQFAPGGGTTLTIALIMADQLTLAHVGDSRAYVVQPDGSMHKVTTDHSLVQRLIDMKEIRPEQAEKHPQKNILLKAVGQPDPYQADTRLLKIPMGSGLLLCSDGLWGVVSENSITSILRREADPVAACQALVDAANKNGGPDNISVIYVRVTPSG
jgi:protein phosphatase